jgi:hypothetical protein
VERFYPFGRILSAVSDSGEWWGFSSIQEDIKTLQQLLAASGLSLVF